MTANENKLNLLLEKLDLGRINKPIVNIPGGPGGGNTESSNDPLIYFYATFVKHPNKMRDCTAYLVCIP